MSDAGAGRPPAGPLPKSVATVCLSGRLSDKLEAAASVGFDGVEIFENDLLAFEGSPADVRRMAADLGLAVTLFQPFRDFEAMPPEGRARQLDRAARKLDVAAELGAPQVLVCSNTQAAALDDPARAAADLAAMAEMAAGRGVRVGYEALAWGRHVRRWREADAIVARAAHPALGLIVDSFHTLALGDDPAGLAGLPQGRISFVQLADAPLLDMDVLGWSRHHRCFPFQGGLDVAGFLGATLRGGYRGPLSLEVFNDEFRAAPARRIARDGLRSLRLLDERVGAAPPLPAPPAAAGVAFLEFAVDHATRSDLAATLGTLGFRRTGRHRTKDVDLYATRAADGAPEDPSGRAAGGARVLLNAEPDSAAAAHFDMHGASVCALGLAVDDPGRTLARAEALLCSVWRERRGADEAPLPAIRAPDGMLVHLVPPGAPAGWEADFAPPPDAATAPPSPSWPTDAAPLGVDHVAVALDPGEMDGAVLFWQGVLGLRAEAMLELPDPRGLVRSRALAAPSAPGDGAPLRLALNVSEARWTGTGRFVSALSGAGVHHVALAVADAAAAAARAGAAGAPMLAVPGNYYADLAARLGLDEVEVAALRGPGLLCDRDADGAEFRHAYTEAFHERFFFELAERRGGYAGYGAANAAVRLAAQAAPRPRRAAPPRALAVDPEDR